MGGHIIRICDRLEEGERDSAVCAELGYGWLQILGNHWDSPLTYREVRLSRTAGKRMTTSSATELVMIKPTRIDASCTEFVMKL